MKKGNNKSLYLPEMEHDSCGIGFVANLKGVKSHQVVEDALIMLENMQHRGACGCEPETGDGAGILVQIPHEFFEDECRKLQIDLPDSGGYGVGVIFFPVEERVREACRQRLYEVAEILGLEILGFRKIPINNTTIGSSAKSVELHYEQIFIKHRDTVDQQTLERKLFVFRMNTTHSIGSTTRGRSIEGNNYDFYWASLSTRTVVYKGQLRTDQLPIYYTDLRDHRIVSALALVHSRFSTNTVPKWKLAQPFRFIAHNGEINTIRGNVNWMKSKQALFESDLFTSEEFELLLPVCDKAHSDSANLDAIIEMLVLSGRSLPHAMMMVIPEAWQGNDLMEDYKKAFYEYHASLMEPWDGPASICFTDGEVVGATLDRNGLRPSRYCLTSDDKLVMASEAGALPVDESKVILKGRLQPGKMFVVDLAAGRIISDEELKKDICTRQPYQQWLDQHKVYLNQLPAKSSDDKHSENLLQKQLAFGFSQEDLNLILGPMVEKAAEPVGSMGADTPLAVLSTKTQHISNYFKQLFAQVSNPPIDPIREKMVMSLFTKLGSNLNILRETPEHCQEIQLKHPVLDNASFQKLNQIDHPNFKSQTIQTLFKADGEPGRLEQAIEQICLEAEEAARNGVKLLILSDVNISQSMAAIPALVICGAVHHHLINKRLRAAVGLIIVSGGVIETHHFATLIGYGANAIFPYLSIAGIKTLASGDLTISSETEAVDRYIQGINYGLLKIFSKMGISTLQSYQGAQIFEILGLSSEVVNKCFTDSISRISGITFDQLASDVLKNHNEAFNSPFTTEQGLPEGGVYQWKKEGEFHLFNPESIHFLQRATRDNDYALYKKYSQLINVQQERACTLRSLFKFKERSAVPLEEVEPAESIFKRFATGAMSFGSISHEAHSTLAIAMNRIGGKSNSGEGGEDEIRFERKPNGDWERSAIKQVASGRFGVTSNYLTNAAELQIKMAQGAKPGEGGQLPGHKVDDWIGRVRHSTPGVGLISPPPHHDIYSIEDLKQLIFDLKNSNREARINVKLVAEAGVGTIAAGVAKAKADVILISGHDGGTGASPISSIRHAGLPWELGVAEAHQTLVKNKLRNRVVLQTDGQIRTGRDLAIAALLGAEEWGVATGALVVEGCIMMRKCHLNTCPVGIATQNPELRKKFTGDPDHVVNFFRFLAEDLREIMASLGFRSVNEMVGQVGSLEVREDIEDPKLKTLDLSPVLYQERSGEEAGLYNQISQDHEMDDILDWILLKAAQRTLEYGTAYKGSFDIINTDRAVGALLSNEISKKYGSEGLPSGTLHFSFKGSAGQSFGAFATRGVRFELEGEANDYFGKGLSGAELIIYPHQESTYRPHEHMIIGNVAFYGATAGEAFIRGQAGERFCVRNSGVTAVVEGVGDHGCEYMTGGTVVVLGATGRNFAAGMSGGTAYIYDPKKQFEKFCNLEMVDLDPFSYEDFDLVKNLIRKHQEFTGSDLASDILSKWDQVSEHFVKVMPRDYKRAMLEHKQLEQAS
ncbi:MAG: glutamate synthase [Cyclobacteriaceae bacterium]|nr:MAG: glutamate synthase [Cyclobacteriaceae bacterium]